MKKKLVALSDRDVLVKAYINMMEGVESNTNKRIVIAHLAHSNNTLIEKQKLEMAYANFKRNQ